jgi:hypothetical protein
VITPPHSCDNPEAFITTELTLQSRKAVHPSQKEANRVCTLPDGIVSIIDVIKAKKIVGKKYLETVYRNSLCWKGDVFNKRKVSLEF